MNNILQLFYEIIIPEERISDGYFLYNNQKYCLYEYKRSINEIDALLLLNKMMLSNKYSINSIVNNVFNQEITSYNGKNYCLIMINYEYEKKANFKFIPAFSLPQLNVLKRNNWGKLWSLKIDYIEYQLTHIRNSYPLINESVNYYIGMAENAISYFNMLNLDNAKLYLEHRRMDTKNIYNPLELVIDYKVRDISEYIKNNFYDGKMTIYSIKDYISNLYLEDIDYILLYIRLLYPSYYFDLYEEIINDNKDEKLIEKITNLKEEYEKLLCEIYQLLQGKVNILGIDWINKKYM